MESSCKIRVRDLLQVSQPCHQEIALNKSPIWDFARDYIEFECLIREIKLKEPIASAALGRSPDRVEAGTGPMTG
jgi:hypothetical protein